MMAENEVRVIPWYRLEARYKQKLQEVRAKMDDATGEEMYRLQGEARLLKVLMNLPEALSLEDAEDLRAEQEKERVNAKGR